MKLNVLPYYFKAFKRKHYLITRRVLTENSHLQTLPTQNKLPYTHLPKRRRVTLNKRWGKG